MWNLLFVHVQKNKKRKTNKCYREFTSCQQTGWTVWFVAAQKNPPRSNNLLFSQFDFGQNNQVKCILISELNGTVPGSRFPHFPNFMLISASCMSEVSLLKGWTILLITKLLNRPRTRWIFELYLQSDDRITRSMHVCLLLCCLSAAAANTHMHKHTNVHSWLSGL